MTFTKEKPKKLFRFILLLFPIFIGTMGTITLVVLVTWLIPPPKTFYPNFLPSFLLLLSFISPASSPSSSAPSSSRKMRDILRIRKASD
ncbi:hypothetical protein ACMG4J_22315 [Rossellomorea marisflavi]|uniref:hypothetical protein n=1 Tax=Rossellomorea marisflavi TaxID=189381 RepID=UPI0039BFDC86